MPETPPFRIVKLWDSTKLPRELFERLIKNHDNHSIRHWKVRGPNGPSDDPGYGPENYHERDLRLDREIDDWVIARGAEPGETIVWHVWW